ncbi:multicopper oxidase family protein [Komagataeibacter xylinus]|uniref:multicopper oxidase family protein n=1 Tax=Komagataeibacter xylinus TaxID=28448 RepID=UPI000FDF836D|nr:multicopper oxidase family protein [Komagataeibacter xylinus]AZV37613.1 copper oxidase [Komagataeibacter xylinus]
MELDSLLLRRRAFMASTLSCIGLGSTAARARTGVENHTLTVAPADIELAPGITRRVLAYNGQVPGPTLRLREGLPVDIVVQNRSNVPELVHWHGLHIPPFPDGAEEEGSGVIKPGETLRYSFTPNPSGTRWYHTHTMAMTDFSRALYSGLFGFLIVEPTRDPGRYDREELLAVHHWDASLDHILRSPEQCAMLRYGFATFNGQLMSAAEPIRVRKGERVLFRFLNASATETVSLALSGHRFTVVALDGNPVATPSSVSVLTLGVAERVDAIVEMNQPGQWVLGPVDTALRAAGLGRVVEYADAPRGAPVWQQPERDDWDYGLFGGAPRASAQDIRYDGIFPMLFERHIDGQGMERWKINGKSGSELAPLSVRKGGRYLFRWMNLSGCDHPLHLHRHNFTLLTRSQRRVGAIVKDTVQIGRFDTIEASFIADNLGDTLFHCHHQLHMDHDFMQMIRYS